MIVMTEEQIINRYVRGWISLAQFRTEMVKFYDQEDAKDDRARRNSRTSVDPDQP